MTGALVKTRPSSPQEITQPQARYHANPEGGDGSVLPSVEGLDGSYIPPRARRNPFERAANLRETNRAQYEGGNLRDAAYVDLTHSSSQTPKRRRLEAVAPTEQQMIRRQSPERPVEHRHLSEPQQRGVYPEPLILEHGEPRYSPQLQPVTSVRDHGYDTRQVFHSARDPSRPGAPVYEPVPLTHPVLERAPLQSLQPPYRSQNSDAVTRNDIEVTRPVGDLRYAPFQHGDRVYEPVGESRAYDNKFEKGERLVPVREQYMQPSREEARVRYIYADGTDVRQPLQPLPLQHVEEYERSTAPTRSFVR